MLNKDMKQKIIRHVAELSTSSWPVSIGDAIESGEVKIREVGEFAEWLKEFILSADGVPANKNYVAEGVKAFRDGADFDDCPYPEGTICRDEWVKGWEMEMAK